MLQPGIYHKLQILRQTPQGLYLGDGVKENEVLLPNKYMPAVFEEGDTLRVFVYLDHEERPVATNIDPLIKLNGFAMLEAKANSRFGAFMDWGLEKELFVPFSEQLDRMRIGARYLIYMYFDEQTGRLAGSQKYRKFLNNDDFPFEEGDEVDIIIGENSVLGVNVIIEQKYLGLVYHDEIYTHVEIGMTLKAFVKKIRPGNKIDIALHKQGYAAVEGEAEKLLNIIQAKGGSISLTDKSDPEVIYDLLGMSKKTFKKALGALYKQRLVEISDAGVKLIA